MCVGLSEGVEVYLSVCGFIRGWGGLPEDVEVYLRMWRFTCV